MSSTHILSDGEVSSCRTSISSDHSGIPAYPQSDTHASPSNEPVSLPPNDAPLTISPAGRHPESQQSLHGDVPTIRQKARPLPSRPDTASTIATFASASAELPPFASSSSSRHSPKKSAPSRIGRSFEALLASDETYVFKESAKVALDPEEGVNASTSLAPAPGLLPSSLDSNRVIIERRRQHSSSSIQSQDLDDIGEDLDDTTPRPPDVNVFQSPLRKAQPATSTGTLPTSVPSGLRNNGHHVPASPDRTTSLQRQTGASPSAASTSSGRRAVAPMSATSAHLLPHATDSQNGTARARPRATSSLGLEEEIDATTAAQGGSDPASSLGSFRQRMKKTSGFLRKLRKDNNQIRRDKDVAKPTDTVSSGLAYSAGSSPSATSLGRSGASDLTVSAASFGRRESKASIHSQASSSIAGSTSNSVYKQTTHFNSVDGVAVPAIPERFAQPLSSSSLQTTSAAKASEATTPDQDATASSDTQELALLNRPGLRVPSAPATLTEWSPSTKVALPQRSSSQGHDYKKSLGSSDSTGAIRLAVQQLESQMDSALKDAPAQEAQFARPQERLQPKQQWGPSPQLPDLDIQRYKERSGSFLEEPDLVSTNGYDQSEMRAPETVRSASASSYPHTPATLESRSDYILKGDDINIATGLDGPKKVSTRPKPLQPVGSLQRLGLSSPSYRPESPYDQVDSALSSQRNSIDPGTDAQARRRTADSGASLISVRSFETAAEIDSADPRIASYTLPSHEQQSTVEASRSASPHPPYEHVKAVGSSADDHKSLRRQSDRHSASEDTASKSKHSDQGQGEGPQMPKVEDPEQTIRLVTKRSELDSIDDLSTRLVGSATTIVTKPANSESDSSALPKEMELSEHSFLRPGRNGSVSRGHSNSVGTVKAGTALRTPASAVQRSASPISLPTSARTSVDAAPPKALEGTAAPPSIASSAQDLATKCWQEDPSFLNREKIAEWLGGLGLVNRAARTYYFSNFDFSGLRLDIAFRRLCEKLFLRAETQQIDRVLTAFSERYFECNPDSVFGSSDAIHSVVFSILLLNTDLHIADIQERMTRQQFVRNTLSVIAESDPDSHSMPVQDDSRSSFSVAPSDLTRSTDALPQSLSRGQRRNSISSYLGGRTKQTLSVTNLEDSSDAIHQDVPRPATAMGGGKPREAEIEAMLRDIYAAVKSERILLPTPETGAAPNPMAGGRRKLAKGNDRMTALKRGSIRGIQGLLGGIGSNQSLLDPSASLNLSRSSVDSWGRTSVADRDRMLSPVPTTTPGFASTLTQTIIKESMDEDAAANGTNFSPTAETPADDEEDDDKLALAGPPWAKEGSLTRKHYWESAGKRAKDKNWTEMFCVVSKGTLSMFRFDGGGSSATKGRASAAVLGGGNWLSNATCLGEISLAHSLANALPPPGYNKARPHVFALTLPGGKVYFFQTGHEELVNEWVGTCNYWAARQSKEPLPGGVSNMEYGWNKVLPRPADDDYEELDSFSNPPDASVYQGTSLDGQMSALSAASSQQHLGKSVDTRSIRSGISSKPRSSETRPYASPSASSRDLTSSTTFSVSSPPPSISTSSGAGFLNNERIFINEWRTLQLPSVPSTLSEERQLARLEKQVETIEAELTLHNELRQPMLSLYSPKGQNYTKALANWERKSNHLLQELIKYQNYVEALKRSTDLKAERRAKREVEGMIEEGDAALAELRI